MFLSSTEFPETADLFLTDKCDLNCPVCYAPNPRQFKRELNTQQCKQVVNYLSSRRVKSLVFTGGEPLLRQDLPEIVRHAKKAGLRTTLSTNTTLFLNRAHEITRYLDEIGIPIDGWDDETNKKLRPGNDFQYGLALAAIELIRRYYPEKTITVRTVVNPLNIGEIPDMGEMLESRRIDRWKLYQPVKIRHGVARDMPKMEVSSQDFLAVVNRTKTRYPGLNIQGQLNTDQAGKYFFIDEFGNALGLDKNLQYVSAGNLLTTPLEELDRLIPVLVNPQRHRLHS